MQATTRGDQQVKKEIYVGVKEACVYNTIIQLEIPKKMPKNTFILEDPIKNQTDEGWSKVWDS